VGVGWFVDIDNSLRLKSRSDRTYSREMDWVRETIYFLDIDDDRCTISGTYLPDSKGRLRMSTPAFGDNKRTWQEIAAEASREKDPEKLLKLTKELERALDERDKIGGSDAND
jgi:hypothetical protein